MTGNPVLTYRAIERRTQSVDTSMIKGDGVDRGLRVATIGFSKKPAQRFFKLLIDSGAKRVIDVRLNNASQLAGFAKKDDLKWLLDRICGMEYVHMPDLAPTKELLSGYRKGSIDWDAYETSFMDLLRARRVENSIPKDLLDGGCLLCSEDQPHHCHRRLVAEYLNEQWGGIEVDHLGEAAPRETQREKDERGKDE